MESRSPLEKRMLHLLPLREQIRLVSGVGVQTLWNRWTPTVVVSLSAVTLLVRGRAKPWTWKAAKRRDASIMKKGVLAILVSGIWTGGVTTRDAAKGVQVSREARPWESYWRFGTDWKLRLSLEGLESRFYIVKWTLNIAFCLSQTSVITCTYWFKNNQMSRGGSRRDVDKSL